MPQEIQLFGDRQIRTYWDDDKEMYYFCIVDVVEALTDSADPKQYVKKMRARDPEHPISQSRTLQVLPVYPE